MYMYMYTCVNRIIDVAVKYKMGCAVHYSFTSAAELQAEWSKRGMNIILHSADIKVHYTCFYFYTPRCNLCIGRLPLGVKLPLRNIQRPSDRRYVDLSIYSEPPFWT